MAIKWKPEPWFDMSRGEYILDSTESTKFGFPLGYSGGTATELSGKIVLKDYDDATSVEGCPGISLENKDAYATYTAGESIYGDANTFRKEHAVLHEGFIPMLYVAGTSPAPYGTKVAPIASGVQEWSSGMFLLGKIATENARTGQIVRIKVDPYNAAQP